MYDNPIPTRFLVPIDCYKISAQGNTNNTSIARGFSWQELLGDIQIFGSVCFTISLRLLTPAISIEFGEYFGTMEYLTLVIGFRDSFRTKFSHIFDVYANINFVL